MMRIGYCTENKNKRRFIAKKTSHHQRMRRLLFVVKVDYYFSLLDCICKFTLQQVRKYYLYKKNINDNPNKHSRTIFAETIHEIWQKNKD